MSALLPPAPEVGPQPPLRYTGGNLALGFDVVQIEADGPGGHYLLTLEQALRNIHLFAEPGRTRILLAPPYQFDMPK